VIDVVRRHERDMGHQRHPVGMTAQFPVPDQARVNDPLFVGPADWVSPAFDDEIFTGRWATDPPAADGTKVVISDLVHPLDPALGVPSYEAFEPARLAIGDTLGFARRMRLLAMTPRGELSSTGYALADPGREYPAVLHLQRV
jgi:hypothetical protein